MNKKIDRWLDLVLLLHWFCYDIHNPYWVYSMNNIINAWNIYPGEIILCSTSYKNNTKPGKYYNL